MGKQTMFLFTVPGDLEFSREELLRRSPDLDQFLLDRTLRDSLRRAAADADGWVLRGPQDAMRLEVKGIHVGTIKISGHPTEINTQVWDVEWDHLAAHRVGWGPKSLEQAREFLSEGAEHYREHVDAPAVRRMIDAYLESIPGLGSTILPGLRFVPHEQKGHLRRLADLVPEVPFWSLDVAEKDLPPQKATKTREAAHA